LWEKNIKSKNMIPGWLISLLTFPGVIVHELGHRLFCNWTDTKVHKVCYFRVGNPAGYVLHERAKELQSSFFISVGPLIFNTVLCSMITFIAWFMDHESDSFLILMWLGISIGMHAFPSNEDASNFLMEVKENKGRSILYYISGLFAVLLRLANSLRFIWFDLVYAIVISLFLPSIFGML
jgi:hypothetical protein